MERVFLRGPTSATITSSRPTSSCILRTGSSYWGTSWGVVVQAVYFKVSEEEYILVVLAKNYFKHEQVKALFSLFVLFILDAEVRHLFYCV